MTPPRSRPRLAVWKLASCDGCQLTLLDCEDELLAVAGAIDISYFLEAGPEDGSGRYDVSLVEGSITTPVDAQRVRHIRAVSDRLVTIGACATAGGVQALRNAAEISEYLSIVYAEPGYISTLATSTPVADHVPVDAELRGCPIDRRQLLELLSALLHGRRPEIPGHSVCVECKLSGATCVLVASGTPCLGPATHAGCGALCPTYSRGCFGCFGPSESPNAPSLVSRLAADGVETIDLVRLLRTFNAAAKPFLATADAMAVAREPAVPVSLDRRDRRSEGQRR